jgi:hypothetical protein
MTVDVPNCNEAYDSYVSMASEGCDVFEPRRGESHELPPICALMSGEVEVKNISRGLRSKR